MTNLFIDQKLGLQGASTLADVLKVNDTLEQLYCENNGIPLQGFTDLVNALHRNTTLLHLSSMHESRQLALKTTEDQVKLLRDEAIQTQTGGHRRSSSVRAKFSNRVHSRSSKDRALPMGLSDQDIKAALSLVDESWERQEYRLQQYLERNYNIANGIPTPMDVGDEEFERPDTATSLGKLVEKVHIDQTPTAEKEFQLAPVVTNSSMGSLEKEIQMSFEQNRTAWSRPRLPS